MKATFEDIERKKLAAAIASVNGAAVKYQGPPTFAYAVGDYTIDRNGTLEGPDDEQLLAELKDLGYESARQELDGEPVSEEPAEEESIEGKPTEAELPIDSLEISIPRNTLTDEQIENLKQIIASKDTLIKKALGRENFSLHIGDEKISFDGFGSCSADEAHAYTDFIGKVCEMARNQKRVTAKEQPVENERYTFRCFLLRLGFIGKEYKDDRRILLQNLSGSSAFREGHRKGEKA